MVAMNRTDLVATRAHVHTCIKRRGFSGPNMFHFILCRFSSPDPRHVDSTFSHCRARFCLSFLSASTTKLVESPTRHVSHSGVSCLYPHEPPPPAETPRRHSRRLENILFSAIYESKIAYRHHSQSRRRADGADVNKQIWLIHRIHDHDRRRCAATSTKPRRRSISSRRRASSSGRPPRVSCSCAA